MTGNDRKDERLGNAVYGQYYTDYQLKRSWLRKRVRKIYLNNILKHVKGKAIDFGCGVGELLAMLPENSVGYEINPATVTYCNSIGLNVKLYLPENDNYSLSDCKPGEYETFIMSHVLEHLENPDNTMRLLFGACKRLGIERFIIIVPGIKGYESDKTHRTFINEDYFENNNLSRIEDYSIVKRVYFPFNLRWVCKWFIHNELFVVYERAGNYVC